MKHDANALVAANTYKTLLSEIKNRSLSEIGQQPDAQLPDPAANPASQKGRAAEKLKTGPFKPEYAGKINFYCNVVDERLRHTTDNPTIGLILCQDKKRILAEYALRGMNKPIGVSEYELTRALPKKFKSMLPTIEEIEAELSEGLRDGRA
jgi:hypothetical protein